MFVPDAIRLYKFDSKQQMVVSEKSLKYISFFFLFYIHRSERLPFLGFPESRGLYTIADKQ